MGSGCREDRERGKWRSLTFLGIFMSRPEGMTYFFYELQDCKVRREEHNSLEWKESKGGKLFTKSFYLSLV